MWRPSAMAARLLVALMMLMAWPTGIESASSVQRRRIVANSCELAVQPIPDMNPIVRTDSNRRSCRGNITTHVCLGFCETFEDVKYRFPFRMHSSLVCAHSSSVEDEIELTDCDKGAASHIRKIKVLRATSCACQNCNPRTMFCSNHYFNVGRK